MGGRSANEQSGPSFLALTCPPSLARDRAVNVEQSVFLLHGAYTLRASLPISPPAVCNLDIFTAPVADRLDACCHGTSIGLHSPAGESHAGRAKDGDCYANPGLPGASQRLLRHESPREKAESG
jgi:hypothetical protein